jgi:hypothetical protein
MPANPTVLAELKGTVFEEGILIHDIFLGGEKKLTSPVGCAHGINKVVKLTNHPIPSKKLELIHRSSMRKLLFKLTYPRPIYRSFDNQVDDMSRTANAVFRAEIDLWRLVQALNELIVIASGVVSYKTVKFSFEIILPGNLEHNTRHHTSSMVTIEIPESNQNVALPIRGIYDR